MEYNFKPIFRSLLTSKQFQNEKCLKVWIWCLLKATDKPFNAFIGRQEFPLERGQFIFGTLRAIEELKMSSSTIWFWLHFLEKEESVAIKSTNKFSVITILKQKKWDEILNGLLANKKETKKKQKTTYNKNKKEYIDSTKLKKEFPLKDVDGEIEKACNWLEATGKKYKDYTAFMRNWLKRSPDIKRKINSEPTRIGGKQ